VALTSETYMDATYDIVVVGAGILGLATALAVSERRPDARLVILEKEADVARHQTGHNSGVIHAGIYYKPGSLKARLCVEGARRMLAFCEAHGVPYARVGKVIVATTADELPRLDTLFERAMANGVPGVAMIGPDRLCDIEPHAAGLRALHSPNTAIVDYRQVAQAMRRALAERGVEVRTQAEVRAIGDDGHGLRVETTQGAVAAQRLINCAGLHADRVAHMLGAASDVRVVPFRGEYYFLKPERAALVRGLIYPVVDPALPFLGVHFTRTIDGRVEAGPNAVLAFAREGYTMTRISPRDMAALAAYPGFWGVARRWWRTGAFEFYRSLSKAAFVRSLRKLVPDLRADDVERGGAGVRAQAVGPDGALVDDFRIIETPTALHVINAPSPAATASLTIGEYIATRAAATWGWA